MTGFVAGQLQAVRQNGGGKYECACRLDKNDICRARVSGPDEPICGPCVEAGHPQQPNFHPVMRSPQ